MRLLTSSRARSTRIRWSKAALIPSPIGGTCASRSVSLISKANNSPLFYYLRTRPIVFPSAGQRSQHRIPLPPPRSVHVSAYRSKCIFYTRCDGAWRRGALFRRGTAPVTADVVPRAPLLLFFYFSIANDFAIGTGKNKSTLLTERYFLVHAAVGAGRDRCCGKRDTVHDEAPRNSGPGHFAGSDDTHQLEIRGRRPARVIRGVRWPPSERRTRARDLCARNPPPTPHRHPVTRQRRLGWRRPRALPSTRPVRRSARYPPRARFSCARVKTSWTDGSRSRDISIRGPTFLSSRRIHRRVLTYLRRISACVWICTRTCKT